jgi:hypothetical protein
VNGSVPEWLRAASARERGEAVRIFHVDVEYPDTRLGTGGDPDAVLRVVAGPPLFDLVDVGGRAFRPRVKTGVPVSVRSGNTRQPMRAQAYATAPGAFGAA